MRTSDADIFADIGKWPLFDSQKSAYIAAKTVILGPKTVIFWSEQTNERTNVTNRRTSDFLASPMQKPLRANNYPRNALCAKGFVLHKELVPQCEASRIPLTRSSEPGKGVVLKEQNEGCFRRERCMCGLAFLKIFLGTLIFRFSGEKNLQNFIFFCRAAENFDKIYVFSCKNLVFSMQNVYFIENK